MIAGSLWLLAASLLVALIFKVNVKWSPPALNYNAVTGAATLKPALFLASACSIEKRPLNYTKTLVYLEFD